MKKEQVENIKASLPSLLTNIGGYLKSLIREEHLKDTVANGSGTLGFLVSLFGKPVIDRHFENKKNEKLRENGFNVYVNAAFKVAYEQLSKTNVEDDINRPTFDIVGLSLERDFKDIIDKLVSLPRVITYQPKYHPAVILIKDLVIELLKRFNTSETKKNEFLKYYNTNIAKQVEEEFGNDLEAHKLNLKKLWLDERETNLLFDTINHKKIGFTDDENLTYETAYGHWLPISKRAESEEEKLLDNNQLTSVEELIDQYFDVEPETHLEKILYIVADFGKGKSVFMKHYAAKLATEYLETSDGYFPIYFNLRNFSQFSSDTSFGIIEDFLLTKYQIKINSPYFKEKKYVFLLDSLDESGGLSKNEIEKVIESIKKIQHLDKEICRQNKIIITSRPFSEQLFVQIGATKTFTKRVDNKEIQHYLSLYGFTKSQFNNWIYTTISATINEIEFEKSTGFIKDIVNAIKEGKKIDIHSMLLGNRTLKASELRRPIFAYMIYQLIRNNVNIIQIGKIGIYLSFINLLSKEAKYIHDPHIKVKIKEQFEARNILHHIASLWSYQRINGNQGILKKSDICRLIGEYGMNDSDSEVLEKHKNNGGSDIEFLSHSYFGENNNILHFQHQSFAEILLAEFYIKTIIKFALEQPLNEQRAIEKLKIGYPTQQTIDFLREILILIKDTVGNENSDEIIEKRKLLLPLLASIATVTNNKYLHSQALYFTWYQAGKIGEETTEVPEILIKNWGITQDVLDKITTLCELIIKSTDIFLVTPSEQVTSLFDKELVKIPDNSYKESLSLEKELALIIGNKMFNNKKNYFIQRFNSYLILNLIKNERNFSFHNEFNGSHFLGTSKRELIISNCEMSSLNFNSACFENVFIIDCVFYNCDFSTTTFNNVIFTNCSFYRCKMSYRLSGYINFTSSNINGSNFIIAGYLANKVYDNYLLEVRNIIRTNKVEDQTFFGMHYRGLHSFALKYIFFNNLAEAKHYFKSFSFYLFYALKYNYISPKDIIHSHKTNNNAVKLYIKKKTKALYDRVNKTGNFSDPIELDLDDDFFPALQSL